MRVDNVGGQISAAKSGSDGYHYGSQPRKISG